MKCQFELVTKDEYVLRGVVDGITIVVGILFIFTQQETDKPKGEQIKVEDIKYLKI